MGERDRGFCVSRGLRVEGHAGIVVVREGAHGPENPDVDAGTAIRRDRLFDGEPGNFVTEPPRRHESIDGRSRASGNRLKQPQLHPCPGQRCDVKDRPTLIV